jgi:hypothetical protein
VEQVRTNTGPAQAAQWARAWTQLAEIAWSAPVVIGYRTATLLAGGWPPSAKDRREYTRMWQEKFDAFGRAYFAALTNNPSGVVRPVHRKVVANRRRLSRG